MYDETLHEINYFVDLCELLVPRNKCSQRWPEPIDLCLLGADMREGLWTEASISYNVHVNVALESEDDSTM